MNQEFATVTAPAPPEVSVLSEHLFRHEAGKLVAVLVGIFGVERLEQAEAVTQEALARAVRMWPFHSVPRHPAAWLTQAAKNLALDAIQREPHFEVRQQQMLAFMAHWPAREINPATPEDAGVADARLRLMFVCGHPSLAPEEQVALTLKTLGGFSVAEIAAALLTTGADIVERLARARQKIGAAQIPFALPGEEEGFFRLDQVLRLLHLLFNEGYKASNGAASARDNLRREAIRLTTLLSEHPIGNQPKTHALLALMLLNAARGDDAGHLLRLPEQDRSRWDQALLARGVFHVAKSATGAELSEYHLQAGIAAVHSAAADYAATDWAQILELYDRLLWYDHSPLVALNRAVALAELHGPEAGLAAVAALPDLPVLKSYYLLHAVLGELEFRRGQFRVAAAHFNTAVQLAELKSEQMFLTRRLQACLGR